MNIYLLTKKVIFLWRTFEVDKLFVMPNFKNVLLEGLTHYIVSRNGNVMIKHKHRLWLKKMHWLLRRNLSP